MASHPPNRTAIVAWRGRGARGYLLLGLLMLTLSLTGCSLFIYHGYLETAKTRGYALEDVTALQTRGEVQEKLGKPMEAFPCLDGVVVNSYQLPAKMEPCVVLGVPKELENMERGNPCTPAYNADKAILTVFSDVYTFGIAELFYTPMTIWRIRKAEEARGTLHVGFVYDADGRVLDRYDAAPGDREGLVLGPLTQQVRSASDTPRCSSMGDCVGRGIAETRRLATCLGHTLTPEAAQRVTWVERIAAEVDAGRLTLQAGRDALYWCYLRPEGTCPLTDGKEAPAATAAGAP